MDVTATSNRRAEARVFSGPRLKAARQAAGLTQRQLAIATGTTLANVENYEQGVVADPGGSFVLAAAAVVGIPPGELYE